MKAKSIFVVLAAALCIGSIAYTSFNQKETQSVSAEEYNAKTSVQNGLFVKVTNANPIQAGEDLLLVGGGTHTLQHIVGASYHYWVTTEFGGVTSEFGDGDAVYCNNAKGELITLEDDDNPDDNVYYLKLKHYVDNTEGYVSKVRSGYLVHEAYNNNGVTAFGDLYIRGKKNQPSKAAATWKIEYGQQSGTMIIRSVLDNRPLFWKPGNNYNWSSFACSTNLSLTSNVNFYRRVTDTKQIKITVNEHSNKEYYFGEKTELEDLAITVKFNEAVSIDVAYSKYSNPQLFKALNVSYLPQAGKFEWCGIPGQFTAVVKHDDRDMRTYNKATSTLKDLRGSYVLGFEDTNGYIKVLDVQSLNSNPGAVVSPVRNTLPLTDFIIVQQDSGADYRDFDIFNNEVQIVLEPIELNGDNKFLIKTKSNEYLAPGQEGLASKGPKDADCEILVNSDNHVIFNAHNQQGGWILAYDSRADASQGNSPESHVKKVVAVPVASVENYHIPIELYKLQWTDNLKFAEDLDEFKEVFFDNTTKFDRTGVTRNVEYSSWTVIKNAYNELPLDVKSYLACLTYNHNQEEEHTVKDMIDIYDTIWSTYYNVGLGFDDFMNRVEAGTLVHDRSVTLNGTNCTITGEPLACYNASYSATVQKNGNDYRYPEFVEVLMGNVPLEEGTQYTYDSSTGEIEINANVIVDDITINVVAEFVGFNVVYHPGIGSGETSKDYDDIINKSSLEDGTVLTLISFNDSGFIAPKWQHFKAWKIGNTEYQPGAQITVNSDLYITAVYEYDNASIKEIETTRTHASLSYEYVKNGENDFTYSSVSIRFSGFMSKANWDAINAVSAIEGYGVLFTDDYLNGAPLDHENCVYDMFVNNKAHPNLASDALKTANNVQDLSEDYYAWNMKINIADGYYKTTLTAVAYIKTASGYIFFNQLSKSVKDLANDMLDKNPETYEGSLSYLANLE